MLLTEQGPMPRTEQIGEILSFSLRRAHGPYAKCAWALAKIAPKAKPAREALGPTSGRAEFEFRCTGRRFLQKELFGPLVAGVMYFYVDKTKAKKIKTYSA